LKFVGKYYLVDAGYACRPGFLPPYRGVRYHLTEFSNRNNPTNARELFNLQHSSKRVTIERAFGAFKGRFCILDNKPFHPYRTQVKLVLACAILHNWILSFGFDEVVPVESDFRGEEADDTLAAPTAHNESHENTAWAATRDAIA